MIRAAWFALFFAFAASADDSPIGLWASEAKFGPALRGELTVTREGETWRAKIGGKETFFEVTGPEVHFGFDGGHYRGRMVGDAIEGWWLQPSGVRIRAARDSRSRRPRI